MNIKAKEILDFLHNNDNRYVKVKEISRAVWPDEKMHEGTVKQYIYDLRKKGYNIILSRKFGYKLVNYDAAT